MSEQAWIDAKRAARMASVDALPEKLRELVHEYGLNTVRAIMDAGVTKPNRIRHIVETVLDEFSPTRGSRSAQGPRERFDTRACENETGSPQNSLDQTRPNH